MRITVVSPPYLIRRKRDGKQLNTWSCGGRVQTFGAHLFVGSFKKNGIAKLVRPILTGVEFPIDPTKRFIIGKGPQQFIMAGATLVCASENRIHDTEPVRRADSLRCHPFACRHDTVAHGRRMLQCPDNGRADRNHTSASHLSMLYDQRR